MSDLTDSAARDTAAPTFGRDAVELVLRKHLPVQVPDTIAVLCMCDVTQTYEGPVGHRLHVADELRKAGLLRV